MRTVKCYEIIFGSVEKFIRMQYHAEDIALKRLGIDFVNDYEFYLRITRRLRPKTAWDRIMALRKIVRLAVSKGLLDRDPFLGYIPERVKRNTDFLTEEEFSKILSLNIREPRPCFVRDLFVFSAFTGLSLCDIEGLRPEHISHSSDGECWIIIKRENTDMESKVILFDIPLRIIQKHGLTRNRNRVFKVPSRSTIAGHLRTISRMCGLERNILFRMARPCFAGLITLKHGVPVETVSRMMGYSSAEAAGKFINVSKQKVADDMDALAAKIEDLYRLPDFSFYNAKNNKSYLEKMKNAEKRSY